MKQIIAISPFKSRIVSGVTWRIDFVSKKVSEFYKVDQIFRGDGGNRFIHLFHPRIILRILRGPTDIILCHTVWSLLYWIFFKIFFNKPYIFDDHNVEFDRFRSTWKYFFSFFIYILEFFWILLANETIVSSNQDLRRLEKIYPIKFKSKVIENVYFPSPLTRTIPRSDFFHRFWINHQKHILLFFWSMEYIPNQEAVFFIQKTLLPNLDKRFHIIVAWMGSEKYISNLQITYIWFYPDIDLLIFNSDLVIAPLFSGGWVKIKVIQTLGVGKYILTTAEGARGVSPNNLLLVSDKRDFLNSIYSFFKFLRK